VTARGESNKYRVQVKEPVPFIDLLLTLGDC
jgi:hypothetical protein